MLKRFLDMLLVLLALPVLIPLFLITFLLVVCTSTGGAIYWSKRVGINNELFDMPKFRSMHFNTPALATHIMNSQDNPKQYLTPVGSFIRKTSLDEIPQLWSVLKGDMSLVGPRPALFNQDDLMALRSAYNIHHIKPGITGWAQINGRDDLPIPQKVALDAYYLSHQSLKLDCKILFLTIFKVLKRDGVAH
jgi:O-antigen biosynthesis protein WbqP